MEITFDTLPKAVNQINERLIVIERLLSEKTGTNNHDEVFTVAQAADFLSLTIPTIYSLISRREIPHFKRSRRVYFSRDELISYLKAGRNKTISEIEAEAANYVTQKTRVR